MGEVVCSSKAQYNKAKRVHADSVNDFVLKVERQQHRVRQLALDGDFKIRVCTFLKNEAVKALKSIQHAVKIVIVANKS